MKLNGRNGTFASLNAVYIENRGLLLQAANTTDSPGSPGAPLTPEIMIAKFRKQLTRCTQCTSTRRTRTGIIPATR